MLEFSTAMLFALIVAGRVTAQIMGLDVHPPDGAGIIPLVLGGIVIGLGAVRLALWVSKGHRGRARP